MSRHLTSATLRGRTVEVAAGFDRRLGDFFLQVLGDPDDVIYSSLQEPHLDWTDVETLRAKVAELGIRLPARLADAVAADGLRRAGNRIVHHPPKGPPVTLLRG